MREIQLRDAKAKLSAVVDDTLCGEPRVITRRSDRTAARANDPVAQHPAFRAAECAGARSLYDLAAMKRSQSAGVENSSAPDLVKIALRSARPVDYGFARQLYATTMRDLTEQAFGWDEYRQDLSFAGQYVQSEVRIITLNDRDVGWLQTRVVGATLNLFQFYIAPAWQNQGIGSLVLKRVLAQAERRGWNVALSVMKENPARRLYERHGFRATHEDRYKIYLRTYSSNRR
jgi:GNAT superfamily N-acetyltransferase